jgi:hypothetical protein
MTPDPAADRAPSTIEDAMRAEGPETSEEPGSLEQIAEEPPPAPRSEREHILMNFFENSRSHPRR